ncbi:MAG: hypothetical protein PHO91_02660 [Patescibacteria group bacterium]|nr:hypothetical protein [Patescibacteria group bacterium]
MTMTTNTSITSGQLKQYKRFVEDAAQRALQEANLDKDRIQKLISRGGEFQASIIAAIRELSVSNQYADEEVSSKYGYLSGYVVKPITEQCKILRQFFSGIPMRVDEDVAGQVLPDGAEGWFAIPRWEKIALTYGEAVQIVLDLIKQTRGGKFHNYREGQLGPEYLQRSARTNHALDLIGDQQSEHDILLVPVQFGLRHRGSSVRRAREVFTSDEFGLGAYEIAIMLLTHPERLKHYDDLWIDCAGDEFAPDADGQFRSAPFFHFSGGEVEVSTRWVNGAGDRCGSVSAFVPQS